MGALSGSTVGGGDATVQSNYGTSGNAALNFASLSARGAGGTLNFVTSGGTTSTSALIGTNAITITAAPGTATGNGVGFIDQGTFFNGSSYAYYNPASPAGYVRALTVADTNSLAAPAGLVIPATTDLNNVFLQGNISAQTSTSMSTLTDTGNFNLTILPGNVVALNGILVSGNVAGGATISGGTIQSNANSNFNTDFVIRTDKANDSLTISSVIADNGTNQVVKSGAGTLTLSGVNTFKSDVYLNGGTLITSMSNAKFGNLGTFNALATQKNLYFSNNAVFESLTSFADQAQSASNLGIIFNFGSGGGTLNVPGGTTLSLNAASVGCAKSLLSGTSTLSARRSRAASCRASSEWLPSSKK